MDPRMDRLNDVLRSVSPAGGIALRELMMLSVTAARSMNYVESTQEKSKALRQVLKQVPDVDIGVILLRLGDLFPPVTPFFQVENERRLGRIAEWLYRGMTVDHTPDILTIAFVPDAKPEPLAAEIDHVE